MNKAPDPVAPAVHFEWRIVQDRRCLVVRFEGHFSQAAGDVAAARLAEHLSEERRCCMVWDCRTMSGYDPDARTAWQVALDDHRDRVSALHLITDSLMIRLGAAGVSAYARIPLKAWSSEEEIVFEPESVDSRSSLAP